MKYIFTFFLFVFIQSQDLLHFNFEPENIVNDQFVSLNGGYILQSSTGKKASSLSIPVKEIAVDSVLSESQNGVLFQAKNPDPLSVELSEGLKSVRNIKISVDFMPFRLTSSLKYDKMCLVYLEEYENQVETNDFYEFKHRVGLGLFYNQKTGIISALSFLNGEIFSKIKVEDKRNYKIDLVFKVNELFLYIDGELQANEKMKTFDDPQKPTLWIGGRKDPFNSENILQPLDGFIANVIVKTEGF